MKFTGERLILENFKDSNNEIVYEHINRYKAVVDSVKNKTVLDIACGTGYGTELLAQKAAQVYGVDISKETIDYAVKNHNKNRNIKYIQASIEKLPFKSEFFDMVISFETIEHVDESMQKQFLTEVKRVLNYKGCLIISTPDKYLYSDLPSYKNNYHIKEFYHDEFYNFLTSYFKYVTFYYQNDEISNIIYQKDTTNILLDQEHKKNLRGKYIIAICSDIELTNEVVKSSSIIITSKLYHIKNRIIDLQNEVEEKNKWAFSLQKEVNRLEKIINDYKRKIVESEERVKYLEKQIKEKENRIIDLQNEVEEKNKWAFSLQREIQSLNIFKNQFKELKEQYQNILSSNGWRLLMKYYKLKEIFLITQQVFVHPFKLLHKLDRQYFNKFIKHFKAGNYAYIVERLRYFTKIDLPKNSLDLIQETYANEILIFPIVKKPKVTIIIPVYNNFKYTYNCLKSILKYTNDIEYEIIIADDMSNDETINIHNFVKNIKVIRGKRNLGFLLNCNNAAKEAKGDYIVFLNNDTNVQENWLFMLLTTIENDRSIGMVGSKLVYSSGQLQEAGGIIWKDASGWNFGRLDNPEKPEYNYIKEVDYVSGASIMIKTQLWKEIGGFDERYVPAYFEDTDLAFEVRKHGYKVVFQPKSVIVHFEGISHGTDTNSGIKRYQVLNREKFIEKWKDELEKNQFENGKHIFLARDKSKNKKHILFIDHYIPHFDQDAGSKATFQYLKMLAKSNFQIHFIGDNFWHYPGTYYLESLQQLGIEVLYGEWYANYWQEWFKENNQYIEYVFLSRPHISIKYINFIKENSNAKIIYIGHDLHFLREKREYEIKKDKSILKSSKYWKNIEIEIISKSNTSCYFSEIEKSEILKINPQASIEVIPLYIYESFKSKINDFKNRKDLMFVGGFSHSPNIDAVLWFVNKIWPDIIKEIIDIKFYIIGSNPPKEILNLQSNNIIVTGYITDDELTNYYNNCRVVVAPLRYGAGIKGKIVDALYNGMPLVTTSIGAEGLIDAQEVMEIKDNELEFAQSIIKLYKDLYLCNIYSEKALDYCKKYFSEKVAKQQILNIL